MQALNHLDAAKTSEPDHRADIQQALDEAIQRVQSLTTTAEPIPAPRTIVVATVAAAADAGAIATTREAATVATNSRSRGHPPSQEERRRPHPRAPFRLA